MLQTIQKAGEILALFDRDHTEWGVREVAVKLKMAKSSTHDLMALLATTELRKEAHPVMEELAAQYQETIHLAVLDDTQAVYVDKLEGRQAVRVELTSLGARLYAHCSALGKVLLAYRSEADVKQIIQTAGLPRFTPNTITDEEELGQNLVKIRKQGFA